MATKKSLADISTEMFKMLELLNSEDRLKVVTATLTLLGESQAGLENNKGHGDQRWPSKQHARAGQLGSERQFFDEKDPENKIEELATAARYREQAENASSHTRENIEAVFREARRNFDNHNFGRDVDNARTAGFFNRGGSAKTGYALSYYGQNYIDTLPDRAAAKRLRKPTRKSNKKSGAKKLSSKKKPAP